MSWTIFTGYITQPTVSEHRQTVFINLLKYITENNKLKNDLPIRTNLNVTYIFFGELGWVDNVDGLTKHLIGSAFVVKRFRVHLGIAWTIAARNRYKLILYGE